jgi:hypothetical protein
LTDVAGRDHGIEHTFEPAYGGAPVSELRSALDGLATVDVAGMPAGALGEHIKELFEARNRIDGELERAIGEFDAHGMGDADGCPSTASWLRGHARLAPADASGRVKTARMLRELPKTAAALQAGAMSLDHARQIAMLAADTNPETTRGVEDQLVFVANAFDPLDLSRVLRQIRQALAKDKTERDEEDAHDRRRISLAASFDGMVNVNGWLAGEAGALVKAALDARAKPLPGDTRTHGQRYADALTALATESLNRGDLPDNHGVRPHLIAITTVEPGDAQHAAPDQRDDPNGETSRPLIRFGMGHVTGGAILSPTVVERIACDATITRVLVNPQGEILDLGRSQRVVTAAQWKALLVRDGGCVGPGHDCPPAWTQAHHLNPWINGGVTNLDTLALVCSYLHRRIHEDGFALFLREDNRWVLRRPDGTDIIGKPRGQTHHGGPSAIATAILNGPRGPCAG